MSGVGRKTLAAAVVLLGIGLMVGGVITGKSGALVVGLCAAVAATYFWMAQRKQGGQGD